MPPASSRLIRRFFLKKHANMAVEFKITNAIDDTIKTKLQEINAELRQAKQNVTSVMLELSKNINFKVDGIDDLIRKQQMFSQAVAAANREQDKIVALQGEAKAVYQQVADKLAVLTKSVDGLSAKMDTYAKLVRRASDALGGLKDAQAQGADSTRQVEQAMQRAGQAAGMASKEYEEIVSTLRTYDSVVTGTNKALAANRIELERVRKKMADLKKQQKDSELSYDAFSTKMGELQKQEQQLKASIQQEEALLRNHAKVVVSASGSYYEMNAAMLELEKRFKSLGAAEREGVVGQGMLADIERLNKELKEIDAQMGYYQRNVGNYASGWNGLGFSVQQIARELPSLAMGWNTFFLAISNNLPMLTDEIKKARVEYEAAKKAGQTATPVWKQLLSSLISWQTALVVGITLLSTYGDEILKWIGNLFSGEKQLRSTSEALKAVNGEIINNGGNIAQTRQEYESLRTAWNKLGDDMNKKKEFIDRNKESFDKLDISITNVGDAENFLVTNTAAFIESLGLRAKSAAAAKISVEKYEEALQKQAEYEKTYNSQDINPFKGDASMWDYWNAGIDAVTSFNLSIADYRAGVKEHMNYRAISAKMEADQLEREAKQYDELQNSLIEQAKAMEEAAGIKRKTNEDEQQAMQDYASYIKNINEQLQQLTIDGIKNRYERERAEMRAEHDKNMAEITGNTEKEIALRKELDAKLERDLAASEANEGLEVERTDLENRLAAVEEGSKEELDLRLALLENQKKQEMAAAMETGASVLAIEKRYQNARLKELEDFAAKKAEAIAAQSANEGLGLQMDEAEEIRQLTMQYTQGAMKREEYEAEVLKIQQKYARKSIDLAMRSVEEQLNVANLSPEDRARLEEELSRLKIQLSKEETQVMLENDRKQEDSIEKKKQAVMDYMSKASEALNAINGLANAIFEGRIQQIEDEQEANEEAGQKEQERIEELENSGVLTKEQAEARKRAAEAKTEAKSEELEKKKAALQRKQAIWNKANQLAQAGIATALAITEALPDLVLAALVGAMGAVQIATIAATPIPKYAKGTDYHPGGLAVVGDGGEHELVQTSRGAWLTPDVPTLVELPRGATVVPDIDVDKILMRRMFLDVDKLQAEAREQGIVVLDRGNDYDYSRLEGKIDKLAKVMERGFKANEKQMKDAAYREYIRRKM